jgi:hypothetical protein
VHRIDGHGQLVGVHVHIGSITQLDLRPQSTFRRRQRPADTVARTGIGYVRAVPSPARPDEDPSATTAGRTVSVTLLPVL